MKIPTSTYRLQFRNGMTFDAAAKLVPYLRDLGISHLYASPIFTAAPGSTHGYDVTDANEIDPALGGREGFDRMVMALKAKGLGLILDIVPNHMSTSLDNAWWRDVVENGEDSAYANHFDIDWSRRLTLPFLGDSFENELEKGQITVKRDEAADKLGLVCYGTFYPLKPGSFNNETAETTDKAEISRLHDAQPYRLTFWKEACRELSYRRFFEVTGLIGIRVEDDRVFDDTHRLILELVHSGAVDGLRVDHIDGLADPVSYLTRLRAAAGPDCYITVEKILGQGERISPDWPVSGTTGYEFIDALSDVMVDDGQVDNLRAFYEKMTGKRVDPKTELRSAKLLMADRNFAGEVATLLRLAREIAGMEDEPALSESALHSALRELLAAFPVYRIYGTNGPLSQNDRDMLDSVIDAVRSSANAPNSQALFFIRRILIGEVKASSDLTTIFRIRFQQLTGPLMAKSIEDTLFFRQNAALALNEVGAHPLPRRFSVDRFHREMQLRLQQQPIALSGTSTHDTKRGEDARARLYTLTEAPELWACAVERWRKMNGDAVQSSGGKPVPEPGVEWLLYQTLAGCWPLGTEPDDRAALQSLEERFVTYIEKAMREAKMRTDWLDVNEEYEEAVIAYGRHLLSPDKSDFLRDFANTLSPFINAGLINSLTTTIIKLTAPGVPDIYQGSEGFDFSMMDPDNRRAPDFKSLQAQMENSPGFKFTDKSEWYSGWLKQHVTAKLLRLRADMPDVFNRGEYTALSAQGHRTRNIVSFARVYTDKALIVIAPRLIVNILRPDDISFLSAGWDDTTIILPDHLSQRNYRDIFTGKTVRADGRLSIGEIKAQGYFSVLISE